MVHKKEMDKTDSLQISHPISSEYKIDKSTNYAIAVSQENSQSSIQTQKVLEVFFDGFSRFLICSSNVRSVLIGCLFTFWYSAWAN